MTKARSRLDPDDVLRGRVPVVATALCALVREVNPSGRELPAPERARRYAQKSRLQSLLVRLYRDEVDVVVEPDANPGVVLLRHRPSNASAAHAVIEDLDEDARSWVLRQIDLQADVAAGEPGTSAASSARPGRRDWPSGRGASHDAPRARGTRANGLRAGTAVVTPDDHLGTNELLGHGRRAAEQYDYDLARAFFAKALARSGGASRPAIALLELLVDQLGADTDALEVAESLDGDAALHPRVRSRLALAAARLGERTRALSFARGLHDPSIADAFVRLAAGAVDEGDLETAEHDLSEAKTTMPSHPGIRTIEASIDQARAARLRPRMAWVKSLVAERRIDEAWAAAQELRVAGAVDPEMRAVLALVEDQRRRHRTEQLVAGAERALASGDLETTAGMLRQACLDAPAESRARVEELLAEVEARHRAALDAAAAAPVITLLGAAELADDLIAYVGLSPGARALVRSATSMRALEHLDMTGAVGTGARARAAVVAVLAFARAESIVEQDPQAALDLLSAHARALEGVRDAETLAHRAQGMLREEEIRGAQRRVEMARTLLHEIESAGADRQLLVSSPRMDALLEAEAMLSEPTLRLLPDPDRASALSLRDAVQTARSRADLLARTRKLALRGDLIGARDALDAYVEASPHDREALAERLLRDTQVLFQKAFHVCAAGEGSAALAASGLARAIVTEAPVPMPDAWGTDFGDSGGVDGCLRHDGRELVLTHSHGSFVFLRVVDISSRPYRLVRFAVLRTPQPCSLRATDAGSRTVAGVGKRGALLVLSIDDLRVVGWSPPRVDPDVAPDRAAPSTVEDACCAPDLRSIWLIEHARDRSERLRVFDTERMRWIHEEVLDGTGRVGPVRGVPGAAVALMEWETAGFRSEDGRLLEDGKLELNLMAYSSAFPGGGIFAIGRDDQGEPNRALHLAPGSPPRELLPLPELVHGNIVGVATDVEAALIFLLYEHDEASAHRHLLAFAVDRTAGTIARLYDVEVPLRTLLCRDPHTERLAIVVAERGVFETTFLSTSPPSPPELSWPEDPLPVAEIPATRLWRSRCREPIGERAEAIEKMEATLRAGGGEAARLVAAVRRFQSSDQLFNLTRALRAAGQAEKARAMEDELIVTRHLRHPLWRWLGALGNADIGRWSEVKGFLECVDESSLDDGVARHFAHMYGLALLEAGAHDEARRVLERGLARPGECPLESLLAVAVPVDEERVEAIRPRPLRTLSRILASADQRLAAGDFEGAISVLDDGLVWESREVQSSARLARALLSAGDGGGADRELRKLFGLATFLAAHADLTTDRRELFIRARWDRKVLDELAAEARHWMDTSLGVS